jgi:hypothetical protein
VTFTVQEASPTKNGAKERQNLNRPVALTPELAHKFSFGQDVPFHGALDFAFARAGFQA